MCLAWQIRLQRQAAGNQSAAVCSCCRLAHAFLPPQLLTHAVPALPPLPCPARSEGGIWSTLFGLLLWDALFQPLPDVFRTPFQAAPLDLDTPGFYPARQVG